MTTATIAPATLDANLPESVRADAETFGAQYAREERGMLLRDEEMWGIIKSYNYVQFMDFRTSFVKGASLQGYGAPEEVWERAIKRISGTFNYTRPKAETPKAKAMSEKRAKEAEQVQSFIVSKGLDTPAKIKTAIASNSFTSSFNKALLAKADAMQRDEMKEAKKQDNETATRIVSDVKKAPVAVLKPLQVLSTWDADILEWIAANEAKIRTMATRKTK